MSTILDTIAEYTQHRIEEEKKNISTQAMRRQAEEIYRQESAAGNDMQNENDVNDVMYGKQAIAEHFSFERELARPEITFICECKKASPSKGLIAPDFPYLDIAREYEAAGAGAISVLTEPRWFLGSNDYLREIAADVNIPCLRKDFTVDEYMIYQAKTLGASAVLLICAITETARLKEYIAIADSLGLSALVEAHDEHEIEAALDAGARIIGVNNRNLKDFTVDIHNSERLRKLVPDNVMFIAESGIRTAADIDVLRAANVNGVLIGETLMLSNDKKGMLARLGHGVRPRVPREVVILSKIKICGLRRECDIEYANRLMPDYIGYVFWQRSRRYVTAEQAAGLTAKLDRDITPVGVFVDEEPQRVAQLVSGGAIRVIQLHGHEDEAYLERIRCMTDAPVIKAFKIRSGQDIELANSYPADFILLDNGCGTGQTFDWQLILGMKRPFFLAGGLTINNVSDAIEKYQPYAVDISSGVETDGYKDCGKMQQFVEKCRWHNT